MKRWAIAIRVLAATLMCTAVARAHAMDVFYGGVAFLGDYSKIAESYPFSAALSQASNGAPSELDVAALEKLKSVSNASFDIVFDRLGELGPKSTSAIALALTIDRESVSVENIAGLNKLVIQISAQALFFDFKEKSVVASYPFTVQYVDVKNHLPTQPEIGSLVRSLYLGELGVNVLDEFKKTLNRATLNVNVSRRVQVKDVNVAEAALALLPQSKRDAIADFKSELAQDFSKFLSSNQQIPVLPYTSGYAIGNRMAARFANGTVFELKIPEADYVISIDLNNLKRIEGVKSGAGMSIIYGAFLGVRLFEPLSNKTYFDAIIKNGATKLVPAGQETIDDWPAFEDSMIALMSKFTSAISDAPADYVGSAVSNKSVQPDFEKLKKVLQSCK